MNADEDRAWRFLLAWARHLDCTVCPKVRLEDFIEAWGPERQRLRMEIKSRHVDFLLVNRAWQPVLAVEVDGGVHLRPDRRREDERKNAVLAAAGIDLLRLPADGAWEHIFDARERRGSQVPARPPHSANGALGPR